MGGNPIVTSDLPQPDDDAMRALTARIHRKLPEALSWDCEAYGPHIGIGYALCFFAEPGERECASVAVCHSRMAAERLQVFNRIHDRAAAGDPNAIYLAGEFASPEQLLNGADRGQDEEQELPWTSRPGW
jgi:hypothetical protein